MPNGTVKWFNTKKGFGFIEPEDGGKDVFVHISAVEASGLAGLEDNQKVTYEVH
ncbi:MAG: cold-shock protein [Paracoccaceae bacterium]